MSWDAHRNKWIYEWLAPDRTTAILDAEHAFIWAAAKDGALSESFALRLRWMFAEPAIHKVLKQLDSSWPNVRDDAREFLRTVSQPTH